MRTEREKALSRLRSRPQPGALTLRISQENSIFSSSRKRRMGSLFSSPRTSCLDPLLIDHFPLLTSQGSVRRGLWSEIWCLVTTLRNLGWEEMGTWGASPSAFVSFTLRTGHLRTMFGAGHGKMGREMLTCRGNQELPWTEIGGLEARGLLNIIQTTLALEVCVKVRALFHSTIGRQELGEGHAGAWVRGRDDLLSQQTLGELQETKPQWDKSLWDKVFYQAPV